MSSKLRRLVGNRAFYALVMVVVVPIIIQNAITNFVSLLDNLMVGRLGTDPMSGVAIANQLLFVFNLAVFGAVSGAGIFTAQYFGAGNTEGVRTSCRYKLYAGLLLTAIALVIFIIAGPQLISLYLNDAENPERVAQTLQYALQYMHVMLIGLLPFAVTQSYASTLRETGETKLPMTAGVTAVFVNLVFNYLLIYGKFGFPQLGVRGAAVATVISRYVEMTIILIYTHTHTEKHPFAAGLFKSLTIPARTVREITIKGMPLLINELMWAMGNATLSQIYSLRGLDVIAATNITNVVFNLFSVSSFAMGSAVAIIVGRDLGADEPETAKDHAWKLIAFSFVLSLGIALVLALVSPYVPLLYNATESVQQLASRLILVCACIMPLISIVNCDYFILRSGGKTGLTFLFDSGFSWGLCIPLAYCLVHFTPWNVVLVYLCVHLLEIIKCGIGFVLVKKGIWINNIVSA